MNWSTNDAYESVRERLLADGELPPVAAHLISPRRLYAHQGIHVGSGLVVHYAGFACGVRRRPVEEVSLAEFARGNRIRIRETRSGFLPEGVVRRARSRLGERRYRILMNNCEHFCEWCLNGRHRSRQVEALMWRPATAWRRAEALVTACVGAAHLALWCALSTIDFPASGQAPGSLQVALAVLRRSSAALRSFSRRPGLGWRTR